MAHFFCKLVPPRPTFAQDLDEAEAAVMAQHAMYWKSLIDAGVKVFALGLVLDPAGAFGIGVIEAESETRVRELTNNDPAIKSGRDFRYDIHPMPRGVMHRRG